MRKPSLTNLETLCWIARLGSFTAAAQRLNTTQPAISRRVRELEDQFGVALFQRQGRRMELTVKARDLVKRAQPLLGQLDNLVVSLENTAAASGTIRMGVGELVSMTWFDRLMSRLRRELPRVNYEIDVGLTINMRQKLELGTLDLAIVAAPIDNSRVATTYLGTVQVQWLVARALRDRSRRRPSPRELLERHAIWCVARPAHMHTMAIESLRRHGVATSLVNTSDNVASLAALVAAGAGVALLPATPRGIVPDTLLPLSDDLPPEPLHFYIASHREESQAVLLHVIDAAVESSTFPRVL